MKWNKFLSWTWTWDSNDDDAYTDDGLCRSGCQCCLDGYELDGYVCMIHTYNIKHNDKVKENNNKTGNKP